jgi:hypothetical protein
MVAGNQRLWNASALGIARVLFRLAEVEDDLFERAGGLLILAEAQAALADEVEHREEQADHLGP